MGGSSSQVIGHRYYLGLHMAVCHGPVDAVNRIVVGEREAWAGPVTGNTTIGVFKPELFGGDKKEGGVVGAVDIMFGGPTQGLNAYLQGQLGNDIPAFRGVVTAVFREGSYTATRWTNPVDPQEPSSEYQVPIYTSSGGGGFVAAMSPYPKKWAFEVLDIPGGAHNPTKQNINNGSANGAHIIFDTLTDPDWGLGLPLADIELPSFTACGDTLFAEGFGLSMVYAQQSSAESFVKEVLNLINAVLFVDRETGKFKLQLIRDDYDVNTLPVFDETNIASLESFERPAFAELVNEIVLKYRVRGDINDTSITAQDLASIQAQSGIISQTKDFTGVDSSDIAAKIAMRELKQSSTPLARVTFKANRDAWNINPGDVIKLTWGAYGINQAVIRVLEVDYGDLDNSVIKIDGVEDIFGLPANSYVTPTETVWVDPISDPLPPLSSELFEVPYYVLGTTLEPGDFSALTEDVTFIEMAARKPNQPSFGLQLWVNTGGTVFEYAANGSWTDTARVTNAIAIDFVGTVQITDFIGSSSEIEEDTYVYIDEEVLRISNLNFPAGTMTIARGCFDTVPVAHAPNALMYFVASGTAKDPTERTGGVTVNAKALTQTSIGLLPLLDAPTVSKALVGRQNKPYLPSQIKLDGEFKPVAPEYYPVEVTGPDVIISWKHQDRTQQLAGVEDWFNVSLGAPEAGVTYTVRTYNHDTVTLLSTDTGITGLTFTVVTGLPADADFNMRVEVASVRDGYVSYQTFTHVFLYRASLDSSIKVTQQVMSVLTTFTP